MDIELVTCALMEVIGPGKDLCDGDCGNERMAMIMQYVAIGSMIIMAGVAKSKVLREAFGPSHRSESFQR